ncbi:MAG: DUF177 domain-containing protein [Magnetococcales bacterium]|nr:DUF177 domain-containing protein [Magnetococcales bacterium]
MPPLVPNNTMSESMSGQPFNENLGRLRLSLADWDGREKQFFGIVDPTVLIESAQEATLSEPVSVRLTLSRERNGHIRSEGQLTTKIGLTCARCLNQFDANIIIEVDRIYRLGEDPALARGGQEQTDDLTYLADSRFSVRRLVDEELILAIPMIPICDSQCAGLCSACGADLNKESCQCDTGTDNSPFAVLKQLQS